MDYRKVFLTKGDEDTWAQVWCVEEEAALECFRRDPDEEGLTPACHKGCAAFYSSGELGDYVMCLVLPRDHCGAPAIIGELVAEPKEESK